MLSPFQILDVAAAQKWLAPEKRPHPDDVDIKSADVSS
jgi:hypothetical protein